MEQPNKSESPEVGTHSVGEEMLTQTEKDFSIGREAYVEALEALGISREAIVKARSLEHANFASGDNLAPLFLEYFGIDVGKERPLGVFHRGTLNTHEIVVANRASEGEVEYFATIDGRRVVSKEESKKLFDAMGALWAATLPADAMTKNKIHREWASEFPVASDELVADVFR